MDDRTLAQRRVLFNNLTPYQRWTLQLVGEGRAPSHDPTLQSLVDLHLVARGADGDYYLTADGVVLTGSCWRVGFSVDEVTRSKSGLCQAHRSGHNFPAACVGVV